MLLNTYWVGKNNTELLILGTLSDMEVISMKKKKKPSYLALLMVSYFAIEYVCIEKDSPRLGITFSWG